jgi:DNA-binding NarL/FixJ family response regulator
LLYKRQLLNVSEDITFVESLNDAETALSASSYDLVITSHSLKSSSGLEISDLLKNLQFSGKLIVTYSGEQDQFRPMYNGNVSGMIKKVTNSQDFAQYVKNVVNGGL